MRSVPARPNERAPIPSFECRNTLRPGKQEPGRQLTLLVSADGVEEAFPRISTDRLVSASHSTLLETCDEILCWSFDREPIESGRVHHPDGGEERRASLGASKLRSIHVHQQKSVFQA
jgi:hypothetical protein